MNSCSCSCGGYNLDTEPVREEKGILLQISNLNEEVSCLESNVKILEDRLTAFKIQKPIAKSPSGTKQDVKEQDVKEPESDIARRLSYIRLRIRNINYILHDNFEALDF